MINVNGERHPWHAGLSITRLLQEKNYVFPMIIVQINGAHVHEERYADTMVRDGDDVAVIHLITGG
ncbi:MAG: sulfur carrier protein ThiS [Candidatus Edwardsbacteria bacterium]|jgi:thiamine biosynthesis protein ThiS|nr:sulfur carrier protein ThiS [Candidatus Edwardsbacteria bacterium]